MVVSGRQRASVLQVGSHYSLALHITAVGIMHNNNYYFAMPEMFLSLHSIL